jgi:hypothetical protein
MNFKPSVAAGASGLSSFGAADAVWETAQRQMMEAIVTNISAPMNIALTHAPISTVLKT